MRSRYSAYALGKSDFIMRTTHSESPHRQPNIEAWRASLDAFSKYTRFEGYIVAPEILAPTMIAFFKG